MTQKQARLAIMFADISGSTSLFERLGDRKAHAAIGSCLREIVALIHKYNGKVIKIIGDEAMSVFASAEKAADAASMIHEKLSTKDYHGVMLAMRVGIHYGPAIIENKDVFGDAVNLAARMVAQAKAHQTIISKASVDLLPARQKSSCRFVDSAPVKGKKEEIGIYELLWEQDEDVTSMAKSVISGSTTAYDQGQVRLHVSYHQKKVVVDKSHSSLMLGRSKGCDLYVNEEMASRYHVRIELRRDKFFIIDQSTNGTHVRVNGGADTFLRREEMPLVGNGQISLGRSFDEKPTEVVSFAQDEPRSA